MFTAFDISMLVVGMPFDGQTLDTRSLGGSESAAIYMAKALAREGSNVTVCCNTPRQSMDDEGVSYQPMKAWPSFANETPHDVCVVQRTPEAFAERTSARLNLLWCHDLALGRQEASFRGALWNVDRVIVLSQYMLEQYRRVYKLDDDTFFVSRNGVDLSAFAEVAGPHVKRDRKKLIYAARPERGLDILLRYVMPKLLAADEELCLYIAGYDNRPREWEEYYAECDRLAAQLGDRVVRLGCLPKRELYRHYLSSGVYVYPTPSPELASFREVSCISAMECQAAGLPIVSSAVGALPETIAQGAGILIDLDPTDPAALDSYVDQFVDGVLRLVRDRDAWSQASAAGLERARTLTWSAVAREWLAEFERLIRAGSASPGRLVRHFCRTSDILAAKHTISAMNPHAHTGTEVADLTNLLNPWAFMDTPDGYREQRDRITALSAGEDVDATLADPRVVQLAEWLMRKPDIRTVLDYGCARGACAIGLATRFPRLSIHGVDINERAVEAATQSASKYGVADRVTFSVWAHDRPGPTPAGVKGVSFDCALLRQILEHVPRPWEVLQQVERQVRPGGLVYFAVPFGPWELGGDRKSPHRARIWQFDAHDIRDMLGSKPELSLEALFGGNSSLTGEPLGWWVGSYCADHQAVAPIDLDRHVWLQRPRQTLSTAIIAGPDSEETLHWMLRSVQDLSDEIVIADCGMASEAHRIAEQYPVRIVPGVDPKREGFERARNIALDACEGDWCLWVDTDEKLLGTENLEKYLRGNTFDGYGIRQHHFACDVQFPPDIPVRLFRRRSARGQLRFWGAIHEHPEFGVNQGSGQTIALPDVHVAHVGYLVERVRRGRFSRNWPLLTLDQERYPDRLLQKHFMMRENMQLVRYDILRNGGRVDDAIRARCREIVAIYRKYFLGRRKPPTHDSLEYYSDALTVLGEGFEAAFQIEVDKKDAKPNGVKRYRFASADEFYAELQQRASEKVARFDSPTW